MDQRSTMTNFFIKSIILILLCFSPGESNSNSSVIASNHPESQDFKTLGQKDLPSQALNTDHNVMPPAKDGMAFDLWARAMKLDGLASATAEEASSARRRNNTTIFAQVGGKALLSCFAGHLPNDVVSWHRIADDQLLAVGKQIYVGDSRFTATQSLRTKAWELYIRNIDLTDSGKYECQLSAHPPVSYFFSLRVHQARASITGSNEVHIEEGSQLALECTVQYATEPPVYIFWFHNRSMVNYNRNLKVRTENFTSSLMVSEVTARDAGTYSCEPHLAVPANITVHVVTGEKPAAMQHGLTGDASSCFISLRDSFGTVILSQFITSFLLAITCMDRCIFF